MKQEIEMLWVDALRSGNYKQTRGMLRSLEDGYCCLGVLCDLAVEAKVIPEPTTSNIGDRYAYAEGESAFLPLAVKVWAGFNDATVRFEDMFIQFDDGTISEDIFSISLVDLNDSGLPFSQIADVIDRFYV